MEAKIDMLAAILVAEAFVFKTPQTELPLLETCQRALELAFHQHVLEQLADKVHCLENRHGCAYLSDLRHERHERVNTKMP